jgi:prepilin-type N-terminal cleavage/methylation domain-containing protein
MSDGRSCSLEAHRRDCAPARQVLGRLRRRSARAGFSMVEVMVSVVVLTVCVSLLSNTIAATVAHTASKRERSLAVEAAQNVLEDMHRAAFAEIYALYNHDPNDDPRGRGTGPGPHFDVPGLSSRFGDQDGLVGRVLLPTERAPLREDVELEPLGMPRDLDGDHIVDDRDHTKDYIVLPVRVRIEWRGRQGERAFEMSTMFADLSRVPGI